MKKSVIVLLVLAGLSGAAQAGYAADIIDAEDPEAILDIAKGFGSARLDTDSAGDPKIVGRINGTRYGILFYGCSNGKQCDDIQFFTAWAGVTVSMNEINKWNSEKRFGKAYLDDEGDPVLEMSSNIDYGVTERNLEDSFDWWSKAVDRFKKEVLGQ